MQHADRPGIHASAGTPEGHAGIAPAAGGTISSEEMGRLELHVGTVLSCQPNLKAHVPAYVMEIDFGPLGCKTTSAQITENHSPQDLVGAQVVAITNLPPRRVAGVKSQVLVLASVSDGAGTVLLRPASPVANGARVQ